MTAVRLGAGAIWAAAATTSATTFDCAPSELATWNDQVPAVDNAACTVSDVADVYVIWVPDAVVAEPSGDVMVAVQPGENPLPAMAIG
jgi:hypothetical protein